MHDQFDFLPDGRPPAFLENWIDDHRFGDENAPGGRPRAALYARRSIADALYVSIGRQVAIGRSWCDETGAFLDCENHIYIDRHRSGATLLGRDGLEALLEAARNRLFDILVISSVDRLSRNTRDMVELVEVFEECGIVVHVAGRGPISNTQIVLLSVGAQNERLGLLDRTTQGRRQAAAAGRMLGAWATYGYDRLPNDRGWTINATEAAVIRRCFEELDRGVSKYQLLTALNNDGIPSPGGSFWREFSLFAKNGNGILQKPLVKGLFEYARKTSGKVSLEAPELRIVEPDLFDRVNAKYVEQETPSTKPKLEPLFRNVRCTCGFALHLSSKGKRSSVYTCRNAVLGGGCGQRLSVLAVDVDRQALLTLKDEILNLARLPHWEGVGRRDWERRNQATAEERALLSTRMAEIDRELDALDDEVDLEELAPLTFALRGRMEYEHHRLLRARSELEVSEPDHSLDAKEAGELREAIGRLLLRLPLAVSVPEDRATVDRLRQLLPVIVAWRNGHPTNTSFRLLVGIPGCRDDPKRYSIVNEERWIERQCGRAPGPLRCPEQVLHHHQAAEAGRFAFSDDDWGAIRSLFAPLRRSDARKRLLAEALLFIAATGLPPSMLPGRYTESRVERFQIRKLGLWPEMIRILEARNWPALTEVDRHRFDPRPSSIHARSTN